MDQCEEIPSYLNIFKNNDCCDFQELLSQYNEWKKEKSERTDNYVFKCEELQTLHLVFHTYISALPVLDEIKEKMFMVMEMQQGKNCYCKVVCIMISWTLENQKNLALSVEEFIEKSSEKFVKQFLQVLKLLYGLGEKIQNEVLDSLIPTDSHFIVTKALLCHLDLILMGYLPDYMSGSMYATRYSIEKFVFKFLLRIINPIAENFSTAYWKLLIRYFLNKLCNISFHPLDQVDAVEICIKLIKSVSHTEANEFKVQNILKNILTILITRLQMVVEIDIPTVLNLENLYFNHNKSELKPGDLSGYSEMMANCEKFLYRNHFLTSKKDDYFYLIQKVIDGVCIVTNLFQIQGVFESSIEIEIIYATFFSYAIRSLSIFFNSSYLNEMKKPTILKLSTLMLKFSAIQVKSVLHFCFNDVLNGIVENFEIMCFIAALLYNNAEVSVVTTDIILEYLTENLIEVAYNRGKNLVYVDLLGIISKHAIKRTKTKVTMNLEILKFHISNIVRQIVRAIMTDDDPYCFLSLLRGLFLAEEGFTLIPICEIDDLIFVLENMTRFLKNDLKSQHREKIFEFCFEFISAIGYNALMISYILNFILYSLKQSGEVAFQAMLLLKHLKDKCEQVAKSNFLWVISPFKQDLQKEIYKASRSKNKCENAVGLILLDALEFRDTLSNSQMFQIQHESYYKIELSVYMKFEDIRKGDWNVILSMDKIVQVASRILCKKNSSYMDRNYSWKVIQTFLSMCLNPDIINRLNVIRNDSVSTSTVKEVYRINHCSEADNVRKLAFLGLFAAACWKDLPEAEEFLNDCIAHYSQIAILSECIEEPLFEGISQDIVLLTDSLLDFVEDHHENDLKHIIVNKYGLFFLETILENSYVLLKHKEVWKLNFYYYLIEKLYFICQSEANFLKLFGCKGLLFFMEKSPYEWKFSEFPHFIKINNEDQYLDTYFTMCVHAFLSAMEISSQLMYGEVIEFTKNALRSSVSNHFCPVEPEESFLPEEKKHVLKNTFGILFSKLPHHHEIVKNMIIELLKIRGESKSNSEIMNSVFAEVYPNFEYLTKNIPLPEFISILDGYNLISKLKNFKLIKINGFTSSDLNDVVRKVLDLFSHFSFSKIEHTNGIVSETHQNFQVCILFLCSVFKEVNKEFILKIYLLIVAALMSDHAVIRSSGFEGLKLIKMASEEKVLLDVCNYFANNYLKKKLFSIGEINVVNSHLLLFSTMLPENTSKILLTIINVSIKKLLTIENVKCYMKYFRKYLYIKEKFVCLNVYPAFVPLLLGHIMRIDNIFYCKQLITIISIYINQLLMGKIYKISKKNFKEVNTIFKLSEFLLHNKIEDLHLQLSETINKLLDDLLKYNLEKKNQLSKQQCLAIRILGMIIQQNEEWLVVQNSLIKTIRNIWENTDFYVLDCNADFTHLNEYKILAKCLLTYYNHHVMDMQIIIQLIKALTECFLPCLLFILHNILDILLKNWNVNDVWELFVNILEADYPHFWKVQILQYLIIPLLSELMKNSSISISKNIANQFATKVLESGKYKSISADINVHFLQICCLFVRYTSERDNIAEDMLDVYQLFYDFSVYCSKFLSSPEVQCHGFLLFSLLLKKIDFQPEIKTTFEEAFIQIFKIKSGVLRPVIVEAANGFIQYLQWESEILKKLTLKAVTECEVSSEVFRKYLKLAVIFRAVLSNHQVYKDIHKDIFKEMIPFILYASTLPLKLTLCVLAIDIIDVFFIWGSSSDDEYQGIEDKFPSNEDSDIILAFLFKIFCMKPSNSGVWGMAELEKRVTKKSFILLEKCFNLNMLPKFSFVSWIEKEIIGEKDIQECYNEVLSSFKVLKLLLSTKYVDEKIIHLKDLLTYLVRCLNCENKQIIYEAFLIMNEVSKTNINESLFPHESQENFDAIFLEINEFIAKKLTQCLESSSLSSISLGKIIPLFYLGKEIPNNLKCLLTTLFSELMNMMEHSYSGIEGVILTVMVILKDKFIKMRKYHKKKMFSYYVPKFIRRITLRGSFKNMIYLLEFWIKDKTVNIYNSLVEVTRLLNKKFSHDSELCCLSFRLLILAHRKKQLDGNQLCLLLPLPLVGRWCEFQMKDPSMCKSLSSRFFQILNFLKYGKSSIANCILLLVPSIHKIVFEEKLHFTELNSFEEIKTSVRQIKTTDFISGLVHLCHIDYCLSKEIFEEIFSQSIKIVCKRQEGKNILKKKLITLLSKLNKCEVSDSVAFFIQTLIKFIPRTICEYIARKSCGEFLGIWESLYMRLSETNESFYNYIGDLYSHMGEDLLFFYLKSIASKDETNAAIRNEQQGLLNKACRNYECILDEEVSLQESEICKDGLLRCYKKLGSWSFMHKQYYFPYAFVDEAYKESKYNWMNAHTNLTLDQVYDLYGFNESFWKIVVEKRYAKLFPVNQFFKNVTNSCINLWRKMSFEINQEHFTLLQAMMKLKEFMEAELVCRILCSNYRNPNHLLEITRIIDNWNSRKLTNKDNFNFWTDIHLFRKFQCELFMQCIKANLSRIFYVKDYFLIIIPKIKNCYDESCRKLVETSIKYGNKGIMQAFLNSFPCIEEQEKSQYFNLMFFQEHKRCFKQQSFQYVLSDVSCLQHELFTYCDKFLNSYWWHRNINTYHEEALFIATTFEEVACCFESFLDKKKLAEGGGAFLINCLFHALRFKNQQESPKIVAKVIWLASFCPPRPPEFKEMLEAVPHQHFIPYIPQLISSLKLNEDYISYWLLRKLVDRCPQAVFLPLHRVISVTQKEKNKDKEFEMCNNLLKILTNQHSTLVLSLERILVEFVKLRKLICGKSLGVLHNIYDKVCEIASLQFEQLQMPGKIFLKDQDLEKIQEDIDYYLPQFEELETDDLSKIQELIFKREGKGPLNLKIALDNILSAIKFIEKKFKHRLGFHCIGSEFLSTFHLHNNTTELFFDSVCMNEENTRSVKILKFLPFLKIIKSFHGAQCKIFVMNEKGKVLPFVLRFDSSLTKYNQEQLVYQLFEFLNHLLYKENHSSQQFWNLNIPTRLSLDYQTELLISPDKNTFPLLDICLQLPVETVLSENLNCKYKLFNSYEMLSSFNLSAQQNFEIFQECVFYVDTLKLWVMQSLNAKSYVLFRKQFTKDIALTGLVKYAFLLSEQYPDLMNIDKITGHVSTLGLKFANRRLCPAFGVLKEVPFRLTPMISHFITEHGVFTDMFNTMLSAARCFAKNDHYIQQFLCAIWINFYVARRESKVSSHIYVLEDSKNVCNGIKDIAHLPFVDADTPTGPVFPEDSEVTWLQKLIEGARDIRLLFRMNPLLFPWI